MRIRHRIRLKYETLFSKACSRAITAYHALKECHIPVARSTNEGPWEGQCFHGSGPKKGSCLHLGVFGLRGFEAPDLHPYVKVTETLDGLGHLAINRVDTFSSNCDEYITDELVLSLMPMEPCLAPSWPPMWGQFVIPGPSLFVRAAAAHWTITCVIAVNNVFQLRGSSLRQRHMTQFRGSRFGRYCVCMVCMPS